MKIRRLQALRAFYGIYFFLSTLTWCFPALAHALLRHVTFFYSDMYGNLAGLEGKPRWLDLRFLQNAPFNYLILIATALICFYFARNRRPLLFSSLLLLCAQVTAYAANGRSICFDIISFSYLGYWAATIASMRIRGWIKDAESLQWITAISGLGAVYLLAIVSKLSIGGRYWVNPVHVGMLLHYGQFRFESGSSPIRPWPILLEYFSHPRFASVVLTAGALVVEGSAIFAFAFGRYRWIYMAIVLALQLGFRFLIAIFWGPLFIIQALFAFPWHRVEKDVRDRLTDRRRFYFPLAVSAAICVFPLLAGESLVQSIAPFSKFRMFSSAYYRSISFYMLRNESEELIGAKPLLRKARTTMEHLNADVTAAFGGASPNLDGARFICDLIEGRLVGGPKTEGKRIYLWGRTVALNDELRLTPQDTRLLECPFLF